MRTTINLPEATHARLKALASERGLSLGDFIAEVTDRALTPATTAKLGLQRDRLTGFLTMQGDTLITHEEVKRLLENDD